MEHEVRSGESLCSIAKRYGLQPAVLYRLNKLNGHPLKVGQKVILPDASHITTVRRDDSLYRIAARFQTSVGAILTLNPELKHRQLIIGERLTIPEFEAQVTNHLQHESLHHTVPYPDEDKLLETRRVQHEYITIHRQNGQAAFTRRQLGAVGPQAQNHPEDLRQVQEALRLQGFLDSGVETELPTDDQPTLPAADFPQTWQALQRFQETHQLNWWATRPCFASLSFTPGHCLPKDLTHWALSHATTYNIQLEDAKSEIRDLSFSNLPPRQDCIYPLGVHYEGTARFEFSPEELADLLVAPALCQELSELISLQQPFDSISSHTSAYFTFGFARLSGREITRYLVELKLRNPALFEMLFANFGIEIEYSWEEESLGKIVLMLIVPESHEMEYVRYQEDALREIQRNKRLQAVFVRAGMHYQAAKIQVLTVYEERIKPALEHPDWKEKLSQPETQREALTELLNTRKLL